jgi:hypothetical protein
LVGVDIGHVNMPELVVSEACAGFVMRADGLQATTMMFTSTEGIAFDRIQRTVGGGTGPSRKTHRALGATSPQINTLVFRTFTLVYSVDLTHPSISLLAGFRPRLILHDTAVTASPDDHSHTIQTCLDSFTSAREDIGRVRLLAPEASAMAQHMEKMPV